MDPSGVTFYLRTDPELAKKIFLSERIEEKDKHMVDLGIQNILITVYHFEPVILPPRIIKVSF